VENQQKIDPVKVSGDISKMLARISADVSAFNDMLIAEIGARGKRIEELEAQIKDTKKK
jgi:hypothetical protein